MFGPCPCIARAVAFLVFSGPAMAAVQNGTNCLGNQDSQDLHKGQDISGENASPGISPADMHDSLYFPVPLDIQKKIFNKYVERIQNVHDGGQDIFFPSMLDMEKVKSYRYLEEPHNVAVIDVGGTVLKAAVVRVSGDPKTMHPKFSVLSRYSISYEPLHEGDGASLGSHHWNNWVASALSKKTSLANEEVRHAALTFSYPLVQKSLDDAVIKYVSKNWAFAKYAALLTENIVDVLNASLAGEGFSFKVNCVLNDAVATYMAGLAEDPCSSQAALVLGTGANGSFEMNINGRMELLNNEVARFEMPDELLTTADLEVITDLVQNDTPHQKLEVLIAGYKFVDIVKEQLICAGFEEERARGLKLKDIISTVGLCRNNNADAFASEVQRIALAYKRRAGKVLAAILLAISSSIGTPEISIIMNGSVCQHSLDQRIICRELRAFAAVMNYRIKFTPVSLPDASLVGAALAAAVTGLAHK